MMGTDDVAIKDVVTAYMTERDRMRIQHHVHDVSHLKFIEMSEGHAERLSRELPAFTLAQLEGFSELVSLMLARRRIREAAFKQ